MKRWLALAALLGLLSQSATADILFNKRGVQRLYAVGISVGNGADLTQDTLQSFIVPAGILANVGDTLHIFASGTAGATTDAKTVTIKLNAPSLAAFNLNVAAATRWTSDIYITKTGPNTQSYGNMSATPGAPSASQVTNGTLALTDTAALPLLVTGQNATNSVAGSITCQLLTVDFISGS
jgi:hypothetical protein